MFSKVTLQEVAIDFVSDLLFYISEYYKISISDVIDLIDRTNYWTVLNNIPVCATQAHSGVEETFKVHLKGDCDAILSRN